MSSLITNATIQIRKDTAGNWTSNNPTPAAGEWCLETDTKYIKIGDGSTAWTSLDYQPNPAEVDGKARVSTYDTGWVSNSDWTNVQLTATHNLAANLSDLLVKFFLSSDGTENNAAEAHQVTATSANYGFDIKAIDTSNIMIQTGALGMFILDGSGVNQYFGGATAYYYKIKVYKLT